jgi:hypothetical protein
MARAGLLGRHPICDFDGTIAELAVQWSALRLRLGVDSIEHLWTLDDSARAWDLVTEAEIAAAAGSQFVASTVAELAMCDAFAVLTNNHEAAVHLVLARIPTLSGTPYVVLGRRALGGSKRRHEVFDIGYRWCCSWLDIELEGSVYLGDSDYELEFAGRLGGRALHVDDLASGTT